MNSRTSVRTTKKERPSSITNLLDKGKKGKTGRDGSPEKPASPSGGLEEEGGETHRRVILNDEILALRVKPEDLEKLREPKPPFERKRTPTSTSVVVRKLKSPVELVHPKAHSVVVARPAPADAPFTTPNYDGISGARFDSYGNIVPHSILGDVEDFKAEALKRGDLPADVLDSSRSIGSDRCGKLTVKFEKKATKRAHSMFEDGDESHALRNWQRKMLERRRQQDYLSRLLNKPVDELVMNQGDGFRKTQELRYLIDRTVPLIDRGKGYRVGSEFWKQQDQLGGELDGMHATLNLTEKGYPPPIEHIGVPRCVLGDKGLEQELPATTIHKPWHRSAYLRERVIQLAPLMDELDPYEPDLLNLEVVGFAKDNSDERRNSMDEQFNSDAMKLRKRLENERRYEAALNDYEDPFKGIPDVHPAPIFGPSVQFSGQPARWTGDSHHYRGQVGIEARVSFETHAGERTTSFLEILNDGTTCIYYSWKKVERSNVFDVVAAQTQRFYFNPGNGVILPGDTIKFPFVFKSATAGIFSEQWEFHTHPVLCGGAALVVTLRGVALKHDRFEQQRNELEKDIFRKETDQIVRDILDGLLKGVQARDRPRSPVDAYITEEQIFKRKNPKLHFSKEKCDQLRDLFLDSVPEEDRGNMLWDLSIDSLRETILQIPEEIDKKQELLQRLNQIISSMSFKPRLPTSVDSSRVGYVMLSLGVDQLVRSAIQLRQMTGYSDPRPGTSSVPSSADSKRSKSGKDRKAGKGKERTKEEKLAVSGKAHGGRRTASPLASPEPSVQLVVETPPPSLSEAENLVTKAKFREKLYTQSYATICDVVDGLAMALGKVLGRKDYDPVRCEPPPLSD